LKKTITKHYGEGGRLKKAAHPLLVNSAYKHDCEDGAILMAGLVEANIAHLLVLQKADLLSKKDGKAICKALIDLRKTEWENLTLNPEYGDIYNNFDVLLSEKVGSISGWLHAGRPRREAVNIAFLLTLRKSTLSLFQNCNTLLKVFINKSGKHIETLMPDFTYLHHAQPTTFGHYILTYAFPLVRDLLRLQNAFINLNISTGESGSVNGSRLKIDKKYFSQILGFNKYATHSRDAMWQPDIPLEVLYTCSSIAMNLTRFSEELQIWNSSEFNYVTLPDDLCRASVIMPQKKNPYPLTYFRGVCNNISGKLSSYTAYGRIFSGNPDSRIFIYGDLIKTINQLDGAIQLFTSVVEKIKLNKSRLLNVISNSNAFATDIADFLIETGKVNYREAHQIVGSIARTLNDQNKNLSDLKLETLKSLLKESGFSQNLISEKQLKELLNPAIVVQTRKSIGGANNKEIQKMNKHLLARHSKYQKFLSKQESAILTGNKTLNKEIIKFYGKIIY
jgi:argininosuccinate lyase